MLTLEIDNKEIEEKLLNKFNNIEEIKEYFYELVIEDLEDKRFGDILLEHDKGDFVDRKKIFDILDNT